MTDRQLASMTRFGRKVTFLTPDLEDDITGYVIGFDDENIRIAEVIVNSDGTSTVAVRLRNRRYVAGMNSEDKNSLVTEDAVKELEYMIAPFRTHVMRKYFPEDLSA